MKKQIKQNKSISNSKIFHSAFTIEENLANEYGNNKIKSLIIESPADYGIIIEENLADEYGNNKMKNLNIETKADLDIRIEKKDDCLNKK